MRFLNSRKEMEKYVGYPATGWTNMWTQEIHVVANDSEDRIVKTPIKHEIMHMITMTTWGYPHENLIWLNEGLATYAGDDCNEITAGEIYNYFLTEEMLLPIDSLTNSFHAQDDMIAYHQSAYIVEYLMKKYGVKKIEELWRKGFASFSEVYGVSFTEMVASLNKTVVEQHKNSPVIDWAGYNKECG
ncbi:MAG: peptidase MA family metallohydrolase [Vicingaceae bacterium]